MTHPADQAHFDVLPDAGGPEGGGVVEHDLPCAGCGYNLRSTRAGAVCPECGVPVARSLGGDNALWAARPAWLRSLAWGVRLMIAAQLLLAAAVVVWAWLPWQLREPGPALGGLLGLSVTYGAGAWMLTRRETLFARPPAGDRLVRLTARFGSLGIPAALGILAWHALGPRAVGRVSDATSAVIFLLVALVVPGVLATYLHLRRLAVRVLSREMAEYATIVAVGGAVTAATYVVLVGMAMADVHLNLVEDLAFAFFFVSVVSLALFYFWSLLVLFLFARAFARAARDARALWSAPRRDDAAAAAEPSAA